MKRPPEFSWQDKAILISLPVVVLLIFILTNYYSQDLTVDDAFSGQVSEVNVRDRGRIIQIYPQTATDSLRLKLKSMDGVREFDFVYVNLASETMKPELGGIIQFFGQYKYDVKGGVVTVPYKGKSGQYEGWAVYGKTRFAGPQIQPKTQTETQTQTQNQVQTQNTNSSATNQ